MRGCGRALGTATPPPRPSVAVHGWPAIVARSVVWRQNPRLGHRCSSRARATGGVGSSDSTGHPRLPGRPPVGQKQSAATHHTEPFGRADIESQPPCWARGVTREVACSAACQPCPGCPFARFFAADPTWEIQRLPGCALLLRLHHLSPWHPREHVASLGPAGSRSSEPLTVRRQNYPNRLTSQGARSSTASSAELADWHI